VERFVFRPGLTDRGRYYAVTFLNQQPLSNRESEGGPALARKLIDIYFSLFKLLLEGRLGHAAARHAEQAQAQQGRHSHSQSQQHQRHKKHGKEHGSSHGQYGPSKPRHPGAKRQQQQQTRGGADGGDAVAAVAAAGELDARMLSALITGVRRAFPYVSADAVEPLVEAHSEALFRLAHTAPFTVGLQVGGSLRSWAVALGRAGVGVVGCGCRGARNNTVWRARTRRCASRTSASNAPAPHARRPARPAPPAQALMLVYQLLSGRNAVSDRFYRALYAVLLSEGARGAAGARARLRSSVC
jgi:hypothetical protein